jgi:hypothetical protein
MLRGGLRYIENAIGPGAQTSRPDDAGPVRILLGRMASPAAFYPPIRLLKEYKLS